MTKLRELHNSHNQSPWIDNLQRSHLRDGTLKRFIDDGIRGLTSNPTIFQKAIQTGAEYDEQFSLVIKAGSSTEDAYWSLVVQDIQDACDVFANLHSSSGGNDGFVSVEVDPRLAQQTSATIAQGINLAARIGRTNVMIKVPATVEGLGAVTELTAAGVSVNVTLIFSVERYAEVLDAYLTGLEKRIERSDTLDGINSVASFFISRVDALVDPQLELLPAGDSLSGRTAINQAKAAYANFLNVCKSDRWKTLAASGARVQRPLWASTSTKNPSYPDTLYVDELIGPNTVNTLPENTMTAFLDHGSPCRTIDVDMPRAISELEALENSGISLADVAHQLEEEGVRSFEKSFEDLLETLNTKRASIT